MKPATSTRRTNMVKQEPCAMPLPSSTGNDSNMLLMQRCVSPLLTSLFDISLYMPSMLARREEMSSSNPSTPPARGTSAEGRGGGGGVCMAAAEEEDGSAPVGFSTSVFKTARTFSSCDCMDWRSVCPSEGCRSTPDSSPVYEIARGQIDRRHAIIDAPVSPQVDVDTKNSLPPRSSWMG